MTACVRDRLCGYTPFFGETWDELFSKIAALQYSFGENWDAVSAPAKDFVRAMLQYDSARLTSEQALAHPWLCGPVPATPLPAAQARLRLKEDPRAAKTAAAPPPALCAPVPADLLQHLGCAGADGGTHRRHHHHRAHAPPADDTPAMDVVDEGGSSIEDSAPVDVAAAAREKDAEAQCRPQTRMLVHRLSDSFI